MKKTSIFKADSEELRFDPLHENISVDVAIIGGGITGITSALLLASSGKSVAVLEALNIGGGTTGFSTGNLYAVVDEQLNKLKSKYDVETIRKVVESRNTAINLIESFIKEFSIDCQFERRPWYLISETEEDDRAIEKEFEACLDAGLEASTSDESPLPFKASQVLKVSNQAQFNPMQYIKGLAKIAENQGAKIYGCTKVNSIENGDKYILNTTGGIVTATHLIHATHSPKGVMSVQTMLGPYREYALAVKVRNTNIPDGIFWAFNKPHHHSMRTFASTGGDRYLLILGEPHKVGQLEHNEECLIKLESYIRERFEVESIEYTWGAQHYKSADGLPYIGQSETNKNCFIATGFSTDGLTYGTLAAMIINDLINGNVNKFSDLYDPLRHNPLKSAGSFIKENINVMVQYLKDIPYHGDIEKLSELNMNEGKIIEIEGEKFGAYKDEQGEIHVVSAVCTHMKCIVNWNNVERTWDCPCHGSRFTIHGDVIEGPAMACLGKMSNKNKPI